MKIKTIMRKLEEAINTNTEEFTRLGKEAKVMQHNNTDKETLDNHYIKMTKIALELQPALVIIEFEDYRVKELIEMLLEKK